MAEETTDAKTKAKANRAKRAQAAKARTKTGKSAAIPNVQPSQPSQPSQASDSALARTPSVSAQALAEIQAVQGQLAADSRAVAPDLSAYVPADLTRASETAQRTTGALKEEQLLAISEHSNTIDIVLANLALARKVESAKGSYAQLIQDQVKTQTSIEGISTEIVSHQLQQERTEFKRAELANAILEREGVVGLARWIKGKRNAKVARLQAEIADMERKTIEKYGDSVDVDHVDLEG